MGSDEEFLAGAQRSDRSAVAASTSAAARSVRSSKSTRPIELTLTEMSDRSVAWYANFVLVVFTFAVARGLTNTILEFTSEILSKSVNDVGNGVLFSSLTIAAIFAPASTKSMGPKKALLLCDCCFGLFFAFFIACKYVGEESVLQWPLFITGGLLLGVGAAHGFTAMGPYLERTSVLLVQDGGGEETKEDLTTKLASTYGFMILSINALTLIIITGLDAMKIDMTLTTLIFGICVFIAVGLMTLAREAPEAQDEDHAEQKGLRQNIFAAFSLWSDPTLWLLCFINVNTGFVDSFKQSNFNHLAAAEIAEYAIGVLTLVQYSSGMLLTKVYEPLAHYSKGLVVLLGSLGYLAIPLLYWYTDLAHQGWWISVFFLLAGNGMAVCESVNIAIFLDFFPGGKSEAAFANITMQNSLASAACFFIGSGKSAVIIDVQGYIIIALSLAGFPAYLLAKRLRAKEQFGGQGETESCESDSAE